MCVHVCTRPHNTLPTTASLVDAITSYTHYTPTYTHTYTCVCTHARPPTPPTTASMVDTVTSYIHYTHTYTLHKYIHITHTLHTYIHITHTHYTCTYTSHICSFLLRKLPYFHIGNRVNIHVSSVSGHQERISVVKVCFFWETVRDTKLTEKKQLHTKL